MCLQDGSIYLSLCWMFTFLNSAVTNRKVWTPQILQIIKTSECQSLSVIGNKYNAFCMLTDDNDNNVPYIHTGIFLLKIIFSIKNKRHRKKQKIKQSSNKDK